MAGIQEEIGPVEGSSGAVVAEVAVAAQGEHCREAWVPIRTDCVSKDIAMSVQ